MRLQEPRSHVQPLRQQRRLFVCMRAFPVTNHSQILAGQKLFWCGTALNQKDLPKGANWGTHECWQKKMPISCAMSWCWDGNVQPLWASKPSVRIAAMNPSAAYQSIWEMGCVWVDRGGPSFSMLTLTWHPGGITHIRYVYTYISNHIYFFWDSDTSQIFSEMIMIDLHHSITQLLHTCIYENASRAVLLGEIPRVAWLRQVRKKQQGQQSPHSWALERVPLLILWRS